MNLIILILIIFNFNCGFSTLAHFYCRKTYWNYQIYKDLKGTVVKRELPSSHGGLLKLRLQSLSHYLRTNLPQLLIKSFLFLPIPQNHVLPCRARKIKLLPWCYNWDGMGGGGYDIIKIIKRRRLKGWEVLRIESTKADVKKCECLQWTSFNCRHTSSLNLDKLNQDYILFLNYYSSSIQSNFVYISWYPVRTSL